MILALLINLGCQSTLTGKLSPSTNPSPTPSFSITGSLMLTEITTSPSPNSSPSPIPLGQPTLLNFFGQNFQLGTTFLMSGLQCLSLLPSSNPPSSVCSIPSPDCILISSSYIQCKVQASGWGNFSVTAHNPDGQSFTLTDALKVIAPPPSILNVNLPSGPPSGGTNIVILGNYFLPGAVVTLDGFSCLSASIFPPSVLNCLTPPHTLGAVDVQVINPDGQIATSSGGFQYRPENTAPSQFDYTLNPTLYARSSSSSPINTPRYVGSTATLFTISPNLPSGWVMDPNTGFISGTLAQRIAPSTFTVTLQNPWGSTQTQLQLAVTDFGSGTTPSPTISGSTQVNQYAAVTSNATLGSTSLTVANSQGFSPGDQILIIQMQNTTATAPWELNQISRTWTPLSTTITLNSPLTANYTSSSSPSPSPRPLTQIVQVPQYVNLDIPLGSTLTAPAWDNTQGTGGVIIFRATGTVSIEGSILASGLGFQGGTGALGPTVPTAGESWFGLPSSSAQGAGGAIAPSGSGCVVSGGGGGGFGSAGTQPTGGGSGGQAFGNLAADLFLGPGGGGAGASSSCSCIPPPGSRGGGLILVDAYNLEVRPSGWILATGMDSLSQNCGSNQAVGGAGAGGTIYLKAAFAQIGFRQVNATGGNTIYSGNTPLGGQGGDGRIRFDFGIPLGSPAQATLPAYESSAPL